MNHPTEIRPPSDPRRSHYHGRIEVLSLFPLWEQLKNLVPQQPATPCLPQLWRFMEPGDFVITPAWTWHDHGNEMGAGAEPVIWLDGLDVPLVRFMDAGFAEEG